jgi:hypothetical protein
MTQKSILERLNGAHNQCNGPQFNLNRSGATRMNCPDAHLDESNSGNGRANKRNPRLALGRR